MPTPAELQRQLEVVDEALKVGEIDAEAWRAARRRIEARLAEAQAASAGEAAPRSTGWLKGLGLVALVIGGAGIGYVAVSLQQHEEAEAERLLDDLDVAAHPEQLWRAAPADDRARALELLARFPRSVTTATLLFVAARDGDPTRCAVYADALPDDPDGLGPIVEGALPADLPPAEAHAHLNACVPLAAEAWARWTLPRRLDPAHAATCDAIGEVAAAFPPALVAEAVAAQLGGLVTTCVLGADGVDLAAARRLHALTAGYDGTRDLPEVAHLAACLQDEGDGAREAAGALAACLAEVPGVH